MRIHYVFPEDGSGRAWRSDLVEFEPPVLSHADAEARFEVAGAENAVYEGFVHEGRTYVEVGSPRRSETSPFFLAPWTAMDRTPELPVPGWSPLLMRTGRLDAPRVEEGPVDAGSRDAARAVAEEVARGTATVGDRMFVSSLEIVAGASRQSSKRLRLRLLDTHGLWRHPYHFDRISPRTALAPFLPLRTVADDPDLAARLFGAEPLARNVADVFRSSRPNAADADATCYSAALLTLGACNESRDVRGTRFDESVRDALRHLRGLARVYEDWTSAVPDPAAVASALEAVRKAFVDEGTAYGNHAAHRLTKDGERFRTWWDARGRLAAHADVEDEADAAAFGSFAL